MGGGVTHSPGSESLTTSEMSYPEKFSPRNIVSHQVLTMVPVRQVTALLKGLGIAWRSL